MPINIDNYWERKKKGSLGCIFFFPKIDAREIIDPAFLIIRNEFEDNNKNGWFRSI